MAKCQYNFKEYICHYYIVLLGIDSHFEVLLELNLELIYFLANTLHCVTEITNISLPSN